MGIAYGGINEKSNLTRFNRYDAAQHGCNDRLQAESRRG